MAEDCCLKDLLLLYPPVEVEERAVPMGGVGEARLIISHIDNENFKSYGGLRTLGPFHNNFTCIIGPNGSGKSNVIDALLFVFGFKASKIRIKKLSVLIHKSELFPNVQSCTVKVYFHRILEKDGSDNEFEIVENSQFVVSRTAFKDNTSIYKINDRKVGTKEVSDFLKKQGIDLDHNRFLILQGEVEQISLMKPKAATEHDDGLLEYLEDIIGSNRFKNPINILYKRLDELCELRMEKLNRVKVVEKEKKDLESVRNDALRYLRLCNEITIRKNIAYQIKCGELKVVELNAKEKVDSCKQEIEIILKEIENINNSKLFKENEVKEIVQQHLMKMQEFEQSKKRFKELEIEDTTLRDSRKHCKLKLEETKKMLKSKQNELIKYENVPEESKSRIEQLLKEIKELEKVKQNEVLNQETAQNDLKEETKELQKECDEKSAFLLKEEELLLKQESKLQALKCERDLLLSNLTKDEEKLSQIERNLKSLRDSINSDKQNLERLLTDLPRMEKDYASLLTQLEASKKKLQTLEVEMSELAQHLDTGSSYEMGEKTIKFLFDQQSQGNLKNIIGRLGDLASVDQKYDIALSTACGRLDNIVTETIDDAQMCVELMKKYKVGKSIFIAMDKVQHWLSSANASFKAPFDTPRAFDLLKMPNERYRPVFYFSLRDLLVTKDINEARGVNNQSRINYRIVTLKGDLIDISGAMTGGGNRIIQGRICTNSEKVIAKSLPSNINKAEIKQQYEAKKLKYNELIQTISQLSQQRDTLQRDIEEAKRVQKNCKERLKPSQVKESSLLEELEVIKKNIKSMKLDDVKVESLNKSIKQLNQVFDKDLSKIEKMREVVNELKENITNMGFTKLSNIKSKLDVICLKIKEKTDTLKKINLSVKNAEKICSRTTVSIEELSKQKTELEGKVIEMDETLTGLDARAAINIEKYQKTNHDADELSKVKEIREKDLSAINEEYKKLDCSKKQTQRLMDEKQEKLNQISFNISQVKGNIDKLKLYKISEDQDEEISFVDLIGESGDDMVFFSTQSGGNCLRTYSEDELAKFHVQKIGFQDLEDKVNQQKPNLTAIEEFRLKEEIYMERAAELTAVTELRDGQRRQLEQMKKQRLDEFLSGYNIITGKLKEMYQLITMGGDAELELVDTLDPFSEGIVFSVRPPKKSWKNISNLSGGEKTLSSLALVFALHHFKPTPFYVMDEIDAALDFKNVSIVANYIKERTKNAQFIIISLRNNMYELADRLVGICKPFNFSKTCVLNPKSLEKYLSAYSNVPVSTKFQQSQNLPRVELLVESNKKITTPSLDVDIDGERENDSEKI